MSHDIHSDKGFVELINIIWRIGCTIQEMDVPTNEWARDSTFPSIKYQRDMSLA